MRMLLEGIALAALVAMAIGVASNWSDLPTDIPTHFNAAGVPDRSGPKERILILPVVATGTYLLLTAITQSNMTLNVPFRVDQQSPRVRGQLREMLTAIKAVVAVMMAYVSFVTIGVALGKRAGLGGAFVPAVIAATSGVVLIYLFRLRRFKE